MRTRGARAWEPKAALRHLQWYGLIGEFQLGQDAASEKEALLPGSLNGR